MPVRFQLFALLALAGQLVPARAQYLELRGAATYDIPTLVDGNSPTFRRDGQFSYLTSTGSPPVILRGGDQFSLGGPAGIVVDRQDHLPMWIESVWLDEDGTLYGWYHHEPGGVCPGRGLTAPQIGAVVSYDGGSSFVDLGLVLVSGDGIDCNAGNGIFAGGHGDFSVILDRERKYFYFLFSNYGGSPAGQGVAMARLAFEDRASPSGAVWKYFEGTWNEPGLGGRVTPVFPVRVSWQRSDTDAFWGPAIHWNTYLESYVVFLNHSCCKPRWPQEGIYVTFNPDLTSPEKWTAPLRLLRDNSFRAGYYPQVLGLGPDDTDTLVGELGRLYINGRSKWEIVFHQGVPSPADYGPEPDPGPRELRMESRPASSPRH